MTTSQNACRDAEESMLLLSLSRYIELRYVAQAEDKDIKGCRIPRQYSMLTPYPQPILWRYDNIQRPAQ